MDHIASKTTEAQVEFKNPAYGRHQLSRPMLLVEPIQKKKKIPPHCTAPRRTALLRAVLRRTAPHRTTTTTTIW